MQFKCSLSFSQASKRFQPGQCDKVPYAQYLKQCKESGTAPWQEEGYPHREFDKCNWTFLVNADSREEAAKKVMSHKKVSKVFGKTKLRSWWQPDDKGNYPKKRCHCHDWFDVETSKTDLGWWKCLSVMENTDQSEEVTVIE